VITYAQNFEDVMLARVFEGQDEGFYIDVGAMDPVDGSVTKYFYDKGWRGINVEPVECFFKELRNQRKRDINLNVGIGAARAVLSFFEFETQGISSCSKEFAQDFMDQGHAFTERKIEVVTLADICEQYAPDTIDFLKIDVEGLEGDVIRGNDWTRFRPRVLVIEATKPFSHEPLWDSWEPFLLQNGYLFTYFDGINRFYIREEESELAEGFAYPPNILDGFEPVEAVRLQEERARSAALESEVESLGEQVAAMTAMADKAQHDLHAALSSRTYQLGLKARQIASPFRPALRPGVRLARKVRRAQQRGRSRLYRARRPIGREKISRLYMRAIAPGNLYYFPAPGEKKTSAQPQTQENPHPLANLRAILEGDHALQNQQSDTLARAIEATGHNDESVLAERRLEPAVRNAIIQAEIANTLIATPACVEGARFSRGVAAPLVIVDARCLQDRWYRGRGVGRHAKQILRTIARVYDKHSLVLLTDPMFPPLEPEVAGLGERCVAAIEAQDRDDAELFIELSPTTASPGPVLPLLLAPWIRKVAVVYDFIPGEFAQIYLVSTEQSISYQTQLLALARYDSFLAISETTAAAMEGFLGNVSTAVTGVANPLEGLKDMAGDNGGISTPFSRYVVISSGADTRKNLLAAIAAFAVSGGLRKFRMGIIVIGEFPAERIAAAEEFAMSCGLGAKRLVFYSGISDQQLFSIYKGAELVFVPSFSEGFSIPVVEAISSGTPVIASKIGAHQELVGDGWWLAPPEDPIAMGSSAAKALNDPDGLLKLQRSAIGERFTTQAVSSRTQKAMEETPAWEASSLSAPKKAEAALEAEPKVGRRNGPRIAVLTPMPPQRSGVAEYSAVMLRALASHADVVVYTDRRADFDHPGVELRPYSMEPFLDRDFDAVVSVIGNSHFHIPILEYFLEFGGACIAHDPRMDEIYNFMRGPAELASMLSKHSLEPVRPEDIPYLLAHLDELPSIAYDEIAPRAMPLIVHADGIARRIFDETGVQPVVLPFVPHRLPEQESIGPREVAAARRFLGWQDDVAHVVTFGHVDRSYKATDVLLDAIAWLRRWGIQCHINFAGSAVDSEQEQLLQQARKLGIEPYMSITGWLSDDLMNTYLLAADAAVQLRTYSQAPLSGALLDCIAFGVPCVTTASLVSEMRAPSYIHGVQDRFSGLLLAEALDETLTGRRLERSDELEIQRSEWLSGQTTDVYVGLLFEALGLGEPQR